MEEVETMMEKEDLMIKRKMLNPATLIAKTSCVKTLSRKTYSKLILLKWLLIEREKQERQFASTVLKAVQQVNKWSLVLKSSTRLVQFVKQVFMMEKSKTKKEVDLCYLR